MSDGFVTIPALAAKRVERDVVEVTTLFCALSSVLDQQERSEEFDEEEERRQQGYYQAVNGIMRQMAEVLSRLGCAMGLWERLS